MSAQRTAVEEAYKSRESVQWTLAANMDEGSPGPFKMKADAAEAICMKFTSPKYKGHVRAACFLIQGEWGAEFNGSEKNLDTFFHVVRRVN